MEDQCWGLGPRRGCTLCAIVAYALQLLLAFVQVTRRFWNPYSCLSGRENAVSKVRVGVLFCFSRQSTRTQWLTPLLRCVLSLSRDLMFWWPNGFVGGNRFGFQPLTRSRKLTLKNGNWLMIDRYPGKNSKKTVPCSTDSMKQRRAESRDCALKEEQLLNTSTAPKSSWQATGELDAPA